MSGARDQVTRMLALVPYLRSHEGIPVEQVASDFGVSTSQIVNDLNVLWFCGLPDAVTGEMIDVDMEALESDGVVYIDNAEFLPRPLRLTKYEALSLIVALRTLRASAGEHEREAIESALAKLESAAGDGAAAANTVEVHVEDVADDVKDTVAEALAGGRRLHLAYLVPSRDEQTERDVDPLRMVTGEGRPYLEAWCYRADDVRLFRLDRITDVTVLDEPVAEHDIAVRDLSAGLFQPDPDSPRAVIDLHPASHWIAEYYPNDSIEQRPDGVLRVAMRVGDLAWLRRLLLRQGGAATVVEPESLAADVGTQAREALASY
ncbi:helix-turn-helix transcriptional regulator [Solicola gregarius]|uniref:WYL domain-containing protein n=1 Tax=Solicola gregarius TaxID=2908642 RepID=A0AA46YJX3_9ACTN|nr:WYL domain-containing protein [Solicola gregarius]UYM05055.1 WYL domain-containing protein [Solicola gregarius]